MAWTEQDYQEIKARLLAETQGVGDVPNAEQLEGISSLPAYQEADGQNMPKIVRAPLELLAAPAIEAAGLANEAATSANEKAQAAQDAAQSANTAAGNVNTAVDNATVATNAANAATAAANQAAIEANKSAENANEEAIAAQVAAALAEKVAKHPPYVGKDHYFYVFDLATDTYNKTDIYTKGDAFSVSITYPSVAALEADVDNPEIEEGDFALVNTNDVENPDNAKIYVKVKNPDGTFSYRFLVDMSGAIGFTGKTPQFSMGTISTLEAGSSATATVSEDGVDSDGNPKYKINFAIPRGNPGAPFNPVGQYDTLELLQAAIPEGSGVNGMIAVGTEAPYEYYAWLNGGWVNQGKVAGGGSGNIVVIPSAVVDLTNQSSSAEVFNAFGSKDNFMDICKNIKNNKVVCIIQGGESFGFVDVVVLMQSATYTDENNAELLFSYNINNNITGVDIVVSNGLASHGKFPTSLVIEASDDGYVYGRKEGDWVEVPEKSDVLTKTNTTEYTPTGDYQPATKKYVDNMNYGKVINGSSEILNNCNLTGAEAEAKIITLFGSVDNFKQCVTDMINNHTRYFYHLGENCSELIGNAYTNGIQYEFNNIIMHWNTVGYWNKRILIDYGTNNQKVVIQDISTDDKLKTMFADITADMYQNINNISGYGIASIQNDADATTERNYPIKESGTLFYGKGPYGSVNGIFGSYLSNRWFARGGGRGSSQMTSWREFAFKDDVDTKYLGNISIDDLTTAGEYVLNPSVTGIPFGNTYCWLKVMGLSDTLQIVINFRNLNIMIRSRVNNSWSDWRYIVTSDNLAAIIKVTTAQYNASSKATDTAYFVTD